MTGLTHWYLGLDPMRRAVLNLVSGWLALGVLGIIEVAYHGPFVPAVAMLFILWPAAVGAMWFLETRVPKGAPRPAHTAGVTTPPPHWVELIMYGLVVLLVVIVVWVLVGVLR